MDNARLNHILTIADRALSLESQKRRDYLAEVCGNDEGLRNDLRALLESMDASEGFWEEWQNWNDDQIQQLLQEPDKDVEEPGQIGPWRLIKLLGRGGMGSVYLAERADGQYEQQAAIKLLQRGLELGESARRFEQERQILARLDHPGIARLYDGGVTQGGRPWLAMQYVDGVSITRWCRHHDCSLSQRLALFRQVCEAVRYAHKNLIVHRDLKPENILVAEDGRVRILDFGIAKLLDRELTKEQRIHTQTGLRVMSLDYAAPEQFTGEPITTATDVYALGLLLYELLTTIYPFNLEGQNQRQIEQVLRNQDPDNPSSIAVRWQAELRGDLDAITLKALRKEPDRRYENAGQLLDDLQRYHSNLPVIARSDTLRYRAGKFYNRHRGKLATGVAIFAAAISLMAYYTYRITEERNAAKTEALRANEVTDFLISIFNYSNPSATHGDDITAREILENSTASIREKLTGQPGTQARLLDATGRIYQNMGLPDKAKPLYAEALRTGWALVRQGDADSTQLAFIYHNYGTLFRDLGIYDSSTVYLNKAVRLYQLNGQQSEDLAIALAALGWVQFLKGDYERADSIYQQTLKIRAGLNGTSSLEYASVLQQVGWLEQYRDHSAIADSLFRLILPIREKFQGPEHPDVATLLHSLGWISYALGNYKEADQFTRKALALRKKIFGNSHPDIAWTLNNLGLIQLAKGNLKEAERLLTKSLAMRKKLLGENHPQTLQSLGNIAQLYYLQKNYTKAAALYRHILNIHQKVLGASHPVLITDLNKLSVVLANAGNQQEALKMAARSVALADNTFDGAHPTTITVKSNKAKILEELHQYKEAEILRTACFEAARKAAGMQDKQTRDALRNLIALYKKWHKPDKATVYEAFLEE